MPLLEVRNVTKYFPLGGGLFSKPKAWARAVNRVSFSLASGETLGLVGESGCGKSTLGRMLLGLIKPDSGCVLFEKQDLHSLEKKALKRLRQQMQLIFQDPYSSLDPRMKVETIITEPLRASTGSLKRSGCRRKTSTNIPMNFPAVSGSASASPGP